MKLTRNIAVAAAALAFGAAPAVAVASGSGNSSNAPGHSKTTTTDTTNTMSSTSNPSSTKAYGRICASENMSRKPTTKGQKSDFAKCVVALAQANKHPKMSASATCKSQGLSKKHVKGQGKGSPYSECVVAVAKMRGSKS